MPGFAYDYLAGGCFSEINLARNTSEIREVQLKPYYLRDYQGATQETELFGKTYAAPFGIAPVGLQGLMWPESCEILAAAAKAQDQAKGSSNSKAANRKKLPMKIDVADIEAIVAKLARIPPKSISSDDKSILEHLDRDLKRLVFGQDEAICVILSQ